MHVSRVYYLNKTNYKFQFSENIIQKIIREGKLGKKKETKGEVEFLEDGKLSNKRKGSVNFLFFTYILL